MDSPERDTFDDLPILADLRELLASRMRETTAPVPAARRRGWAVSGLRLIPIALAVAVALVVVAVGLFALHHRSPAGGHRAAPAAPSLPPPPTAPTSGYVQRAQQETIARDHACRSGSNRGQTIDQGSPPQALLSVLGVLRRPALPPDPTNKVLYSIGWDKGAGVYVNYIRRARTEFGRSYWLVPEARIYPFAPIPARCYREFRARLVHDMRHRSPSLRRQALRDQQSTLAIQRQQTLHRGGLCFIEIGLHVHPHPGAVGFGCGSGPTDANPLDGGSTTGDRGGGTITSGVVPDEVAAVTMRFAASGRDRARSITSDVVNNVYVLKIPPHTSAFPSETLLKMSSGGVRTISFARPQVKAVGGGAGGGG